MLSKAELMSVTKDKGIEVCLTYTNEYVLRRVDENICSIHSDGSKIIIDYCPSVSKVFNSKIEVLSNIDYILNTGIKIRSSLKESTLELEKKLTYLSHIIDDYTAECSIIRLNVLTCLNIDGDEIFVTILENNLLEVDCYGDIKVINNSQLFSYLLKDKYVITDTLLS